MRPKFTHRYEAIATPEKLAWLVAEMAKQKQISVDTETTSVYPRWAEIVGYSFAWNEGEAYYVPVRARKVNCSSIPNKHWKRCGRFWKTLPSPKLART